MNRTLVGGINEFNAINYGKDGQTIGDVSTSKILNLFNLGGISDNDLINRLEKALGKDINSPETLDYINTLYSKALSFYKKTLLIDLKEPFTGQKFSLKKDVTDFLRLTATSQNPERRQIYCDLVKITFCYHEIEKHPQMKFAEENTRRHIADNYFKKGVHSVGDFEFDIASIMEKKKGEDYYETSGYYLKKISSLYKRIPCTLRYRGKNPEKMVVKILGSEKGSSKILDIIKDSIGVELEANNKEDSVYLLEYMYHIHKETGNIEQTEFRQKPNFYTAEDLEKFFSLEDLSSEFRNYLKRLIELKKEIGSKKYQDCKLKGIVDVGEGLFNGCESRVVLKGNKNQSGLSASSIIDGKKLIEAIIGLRGWVSKSYISRIVDAVTKNPRILKSREAIEEEYITPLIKVQVPKLDRNIYSSRKRLEEVIKNASEYPDFIINAIEKNLTMVSDVISGVKGEALKTL